MVKYYASPLGLYPFDPISPFDINSLGGEIGQSPLIVTSRASTQVYIEAFSKHIILTIFLEGGGS